MKKKSKVVSQALEMAEGYMAENPDMAEMLLSQLHKMDPENVKVLQLLGLCKHQMQEDDKALPLFQKALELEPNADNHGNVALAYSGLKQHTKAVETLRKAIELNPKQSLFYSNLAIQYHALGQIPQAVEVMKQAIALTPERAVLWNNMGGLHVEARDFAEGIRCYEHAITLDATDLSAHMNLGLAFHFTGQWQKGFREFEWRYQWMPEMRHVYTRAYNMKKYWTGKTSIKGKRILIHGEQGYGDIIMFGRFAKNFRDLGAHVTVNVPVALHFLFTGISGVNDVVNRDIFQGDKLPEHDYHFASMSAPHLLGLEEISGQPYIQPYTHQTRDWIKKNWGDTFNVGLVWGGNPKQPDNQRRSIPLAEFSRLSSIPKVRLFSLQIEPTAKAQMEGTDIIDLTPKMETFADTANTIAGLDLVIGCQTAVMHLAGAMGVPVWTLLDYAPDWRWGVEGERTMWYDSMRLFRQSAPGNWSEVFDHVERKLREQIGTSSLHTPPASG